MHLRSMSLTPTSIVMNATSLLWLVRNATAASSCVPAAYEQPESTPVIIARVVSPGHPNFRTVSVGIVPRALLARSSTYP